MSVKQHDDRSGVHYLEGLLAIDVAGASRQTREKAIESVLAENDNWRRAGTEMIAREFGESAAERVLEHLDILQVDDPAESARRLSGRAGIAAAPIHAVGFSWHRPMAGLRPGKVPEGTVLGPARDGGDRVIAVVDTGISPVANLPDWIAASTISGGDDLDVLADDDGGSHGTFVTSVLRQIAPTHTVSIARASAIADDAGRAGERSPDHPEPDPTTEFHVADAIHRLIERHRGDNSRVEALNLSLGGPVVEGTTMVTVRSAIARWRETFPKAPIFAAAGNTDGAGPVYPAAFGYVRGVSAAANGGAEVVWDGDGNPQSPGGDRWWVDDLAPGVDLVGLSGRAADHVISWSGSSFATAVATASFVNGGPVEVRKDVAYWPNVAMRYGDVPGLHYL